MNHSADLRLVHMNLKSLAKDTAIYGLSSIVGRFLNYLLVPLYTYRIAAESGGYGIVTNLYAYTALFLALLTFGMETTLFRFSNKEGEDAKKVYGTILRLVGFVGIAFLAAVLSLLKPISAAMGYAAHPEYVGCMAIIVAFDAFQAIMFSRLRLERRPLKFMALKFAFIIPNILLNLFIFLVMPLLFDKMPALHDLYVNYDYGVGLIFFTNLICTSCVFLGFIPELKGLGYGYDKSLAKRLLKYTWPLLVLSLVGILNQVADKILFPYLMPGTEGKVQLGIYGACVKIAMIMSLLTQAFRYAYEPIVFNGSRDKNSPETLAEGMKYFVIFTLLAFLAVMFYMPVLRHFIQPDYWAGLGVIPIVMMAEIFMGIYFNLSFWYKLSDQTYWGAIMSAIGAAVMIAVNVIFVPKIGYWACAWGGFAGYGTAMLLSYFIGQKKYPVGYDIRTVALFSGLAAAMFTVDLFCLKNLPVWLRLAIDTLQLLLYVYLIWKEIKRKR
ncbi:MAG: lipopolysaccharide biosynthesis protein [Bacteroidales bacterium]|nr:lipopolysaccharide biosynthesis protein [Bacteroidales bacterium]